MTRTLCVLACILGTVGGCTIDPMVQAVPLPAVYDGGGYSATVGDYGYRPYDGSLPYYGYYDHRYVAGYRYGRYYRHPARVYRHGAYRPYAGSYRAPSRYSAPSRSSSGGFRRR